MNNDETFLKVISFEQALIASGKMFNMVNIFSCSASHNNFNIAYQLSAVVVSNSIGRCYSRYPRSDRQYMYYACLNIV